jgi:hypothetical protein
MGWGIAMRLSGYSGESVAFKDGPNVGIKNGFQEMGEAVTIDIDPVGEVGH